MARILVVDDECSILEILGMLLKQRGHQVTLATGGREALALFRERRFDLVLSDVMMEDMDGFELLDALRPHLDDRVPFIILSSHDDPVAIESALYAGAFDYLVKPIEPATVHRVVDRALQVVGDWRPQTPEMRT